MKRLLHASSLQHCYVVGGLYATNVEVLLPEYAAPYFGAGPGTPWLQWLDPRVRSGPGTAGPLDGKETGQG